MNLVRSENDTAKKKSSPSKKFQHISGFLDGFWALRDDSGPGGVVWVTLSGQEDGCDLFESRAALGSHLRRHANSQARRRRSIVVLRKSGFGSEILFRFD